MREEDIFDEIAIQVSTDMGRLFHRFSKHEHLIANVVADSLCGLIAIAAKHPDVTLERVVTRMKAFDWQKIRAEHYMEVKGVKKDGKVIHLGRTLEKL